MRKIRQNIHGNYVGYIGGRREEFFGDDEVTAGYWLLTGIHDRYTGYSKEWITRCKEAALKS